MEAIDRFYEKVRILLCTVSSLDIYPMEKHGEQEPFSVNNDVAAKPNDRASSRLKGIT